MLISTPRISPATRGAGSNYKNPRIEPPDHGIGRSRGGLTSKIHHLVDGGFDVSPRDAEEMDRLQEESVALLDRYGKDV